MLFNSIILIKQVNCYLKTSNKDILLTQTPTPSLEKRRGEGMSFSNEQIMENCLGCPNHFL